MLCEAESVLSITQNFLMINSSYLKRDLFQPPSGVIDLSVDRDSGPIYSPSLLVNHLEVSQRAVN